ncbi:MAG: exonuclease domain-containing protein [Spirochaetales bacterium]
MADSLVLLRLAVPNLLSYSLGKAAFVLGVETGTSHRALDDARTCMHLFTQSARKLAGTCP